MTLGQAFRLTKRKWDTTGGSGDEWEAFKAEMRQRSVIRLEEYDYPLLRFLTKDFGEWIYADGEELVIVYHRIQPGSWGSGDPLNRKIGVESYADLHKLQRKWATGR